MSCDPWPFLKIFTDCLWISRDLDLDICGRFFFFSVFFFFFGGGGGAGYFENYRYILWYNDIVLMSKP